MQRIFKVFNHLAKARTYICTDSKQQVTSNNKTYKPLDW